jgi:hypothetical protein
MLPPLTITEGVQSAILAGGVGAAVGLGRCPVRVQGSKVRFADQPGV